MPRKAVFHACVPAEVDEAMAVVPGLPELSVEGTRFAAPSAKNDLLDAYKLFMRSKVDAAGTALPPELDADLAELRTMLALPERKADDTRAALVADAYQTILAEAVRGGRLDDAESPAAVLNELITRVAMPGEQALAMHLSMYRQKLRECLEDSKIDDEDARALARTARLLCLKAEQVAEVDGELKGEVLRATIRRAMDAGVEKFSDELAEEVEAAKRELRMADSEAFEALEAIARSELVRMVNSARNKGALAAGRRLRYDRGAVLCPVLCACPTDRPVRCRGPQRLFSVRGQCVQRGPGACGLLAMRTAPAFTEPRGCIRPLQARTHRVHPCTASGARDASR